MTGQRHGNSIDGEWRACTAAEQRTLLDMEVTYDGLIQVMVPRAELVERLRRERERWVTTPRGGIFHMPYGGA